MQPKPRRRLAGTDRSKSASPSIVPISFPCAEVGAAGLRLRVRVQPRASRTRVVGIRGDALAVTVQAPPVDGAANQAVVTLIADWLGVAKSRVAVVRGDTARSKTLAISGATVPELLEHLERALAALR